MTEDVSFFQDDGYRLDATLYQRSSDPKILIVFCNGFCASRRMLAPEFGEALIGELDCAVLAPDYSGWGTSEGPRERLDPEREVRDLRASTSWMLQRFPQRREQLALFGISFGAAISTMAAARDDRVKALVALSGFENGDRVARDYRTHWDYLDLLDKIDEDRLARVLTGVSEPADPLWVSPRDPAALAFNEKLLAEFPERRFSLDVLSAEYIREFNPGREAARLRGRPSLFIAGERDLRIPWQHSADQAEKAGGAFRLVPGLGHYDFYTGKAFSDLLETITQFFSSAFGHEPEKDS